MTLGEMNAMTARLLAEGANPDLLVCVGQSTPSAVGMAAKCVGVRYAPKPGLVGYEAGKGEFLFLGGVADDNDFMEGLDSCDDVGTAG